jgi:hypothetical protein
MADKFDSTSIYDLEWKTVDNEGVEQVFTFKPLPFSYYPKLYSLLNKLSEADLMSKKNVELPEEEQAKKFMESLSEELVQELVGLEKSMVKNSYPALSDDKVEKFVTSNAFELLEPLMSLMNRSERANQRKAKAVHQP